MGHSEISGRKHLGSFCGPIGTHKSDPFDAFALEDADGKLVAEVRCLRPRDVVVMQYSTQMFAAIRRLLGVLYKDDFEAKKKALNELRELVEWIDGQERRI